MRLLVLGDRDPQYLTHREIDAAPALTYGERRTVTPVSGTRLSSICGADPFEGFHFCGYGLAERFASVLERAGVVISASAPDVGVEAIELPDQL